MSGVDANAKASQRRVVTTRVVAQPLVTLIVILKAFSRGKGWTWTFKNLVEEMHDDHV